MSSQSPSHTPPTDKKGKLGRLRGIWKPDSGGHRTGTRTGSVGSAALALHCMLVAESVSPAAMLWHAPALGGVPLRASHTPLAKALVCSSWGHGPRPCATYVSPTYRARQLSSHGPGCSAGEAGPSVPKDLSVTFFH